VVGFREYDERSGRSRTPVLPGRPPKPPSTLVNASTARTPTHAVGFGDVAAVGPDAPPGSEGTHLAAPVLRIGRDCALPAVTSLKLTPILGYRSYSIAKIPNETGPIPKCPSWKAAPWLSSGRTEPSLTESPKSTAQGLAAGLIATTTRCVVAVRK
jgi:hypothetical protein